MPDPTIRIFISYAHEDVALKDQLVAHLAFLERTDRATIWHDQMIGAGDEWRARIRRQLAECQIVLLLVSPDFIDSDFIQENELHDALMRHDEGTARVIPVILRECRFDGLPFSRLQAVPTFAQPVTTFEDRDSAMTEVAVAVESVVEELRHGRSDVRHVPPQQRGVAEMTRVYFLAHPDDADYSARIQDKMHPAALTAPFGIELIDHWNLPPGTVTSEQLGHADIVVLVMSGRMLNSPRVTDAYRQVVEMHERGTVRLVIAQARRFMVATSPFQDVPVFPRADVALIDLDEGARDEAVFRIAHALTVEIYSLCMARDGLLAATQRYRADVETEPSESAVKHPARSSKELEFDFLADEDRMC